MAPGFIEALTIDLGACAANVVMIASLAAVAVPCIMLLPSRTKNKPTVRVPPPSESFDYIIVGGGLAGCVLAARLSEDTPYLNVISPIALAQWALGGCGVLSTTFCDHGAFVRSEPSRLEHPDLQLRFIPGLGPAADGVESYRLLGKGVQHNLYGMTAQVICCRPKSTGSVTITDADPSIAPRIQLAYLSHPEDFAALKKGLALARRIATSGALGEVSAKEVYPGAQVQSDAAIEHYIRSTVHSANGLSGGCCLGTVVDARLRVKGVVNLRVADASVMPTIPGGQLALPTTMIAERAASFIRGEKEVAAAPSQHRPATSPRRRRP